MSRVGGADRALYVTFTCNITRCLRSKKVLYNGGKECGVVCAMDGMRNTMAGLGTPYSPTRRKVGKPRSKSKGRSLKQSKPKEPPNNQVEEGDENDRNQRRKNSFLDYHPSCASTAALAAGTAWPRLRDNGRGPAHVARTLNESIERLRWHDSSLTAINLKVLICVCLCIYTCYDYVCQRRETTLALLFITTRSLEKRACSN